MVTKTAILGGFRRVGEIWVAAQEHFGSVKRSLRAGFVGKKRVNGSVASARDAKTGISRFGDHSGALPVRRGRNPCFSPQQSPSIINRKTRIEKNRKNKRPAANPQTRNFRHCGRAQLAFLRALRLAPQSTKSQQKKTHVHSGIRTRNRQYAYLLLPRPPPTPSMLVLAGQNKKWALSVLFCT